MLSFSEYLTERFVNLIGTKDEQEKEKYVDSVWDMVQKSYASIGGQKGKGFSSKEDMVKNIPFWKLVRKNGNIVAGSLYRDKGGRKRVASFTDGTNAGKEAIADIMRNDFERSYFEISKASLGFAYKQLGGNFLKRYAKTPEEVERISGKELHPVPEDDSHYQKFPELRPYLYQRDINGKLETKIMLGTRGNKIQEF